MELRIISIADSFDAMVIDRPYRKKLSLLKTIDELRKNEGTKFDMNITEIFIKKVLHKENLQ